MSVSSMLSLLFPRIKRCQICATRLVLNEEQTYWVCPKCGYMEPNY